MKGWMMLVTGPDAGADKIPMRRLVAVPADNTDEAFELARAAVPGCVPVSVGPLAEDAATDLGLAAGKNRILGSY